MSKNSTPFKELSNKGANDTKGEKQGQPCHELVWAIVG
jgi:hypothetical protein